MVGGSSSSIPNNALKISRSVRWRTYVQDDVKNLNSNELYLIGTVHHQ